MDYSQPFHDDNPSGTSPWGSPGTSPQPNRTTFNSAGGALAPPAFQGFTPNPAGNGLGAAEDDAGFGDSDTGFTRPTTANSAAPAPEGQADNSGTDAPEGGESQSQAAAGQAPTAAQQDAKAQGGQQQQNQDSQQPDSQPRRPPQPLFKLQAKITGLERTGRKDPILRFDVHTNIPKFRTTQYRDIRRLHSEFVKLAEHLISSNPEAIVPAVPPPLTSAGAGTDEDEVRVKGLMQRWLNYVCSNDVLLRDDEMVRFVESDFGYSPTIKKKQPATGVRRKILKQFAPPPDDTPELQDSRPIVKLFYLGAMDGGHKVDKLVKARRGLGLAESDFGVKLGAMHVQELHQGLANAYRKLGKVIQTVGDCHAAQATAEATTIGDPLQHHSSDAFIVKETLTNRQILIREFLQAQETTRSKLNAADRLRGSSNVRREKVDEAIASLDEARRNETYLEQKTQRVTQNLVQERRRWFARTAADLRLSIREYVLREIEAERRTLALLETVRPDIRGIDGSGGLSRLGREAHPPQRRVSMAASQGPKGDAWSGVPRRSDAAAASVTASMIGTLPEDGEGDDATETSRPKGMSSTADEDDGDRLDARNAASRLATSTF
ncbi:vacuolar protein sorting-associated protein 17 [Gaeumannomyces tritici R3-111a-1]|uniref:Vacuolar protein sorting-associated protein 17 n=1 Tax=Gaeumannomyces tritici (strain R3-111a-1) TaxID=644352 RepID=J3NPB6_GAET3|nr:vacuolar protein sorting-associated protein 17 [Gaeumannomyces tritici R3-111a-1]EJT78021.1 vacuolar protein sorting-associated protein 17 [Gaeumannomyces tritici R3-111a-1]